jgi:hypothetical protein
VDVNLYVPQQYIKFSNQVQAADSLAPRKITLLTASQVLCLLAASYCFLASLTLYT